MLLSREQILKADDLKTEDVPVPEWGGDVRIKTLKGKERDAFEQSMVETKGGKQRQNLKNFRAKLIAKCVVNENGELMFSPPDIEPLGEKSAAALSRVFDACQKLNGFSESDVEELTEGFDDAPSEDSTSG
ncbi:hypothetical protein [Streptomyces atriruber]|uniref:hypothetical protein n=1 Tax=Streptomyces atriruber TaxID=545121 RepID=UPI0006E198FF|nr:hypothetical protein [Streptomyces atriruber]